MTQGDMYAKVLFKVCDRHHVVRFHVIYLLNIHLMELVRRPIARIIFTGSLVFKINKKSSVSSA